MRFYIESYGCTLNHGEARYLMRLLMTMGHTREFDPDTADVLVIFTCTVIRATELKMLRQFKRYNELNKPVIISGCMAVVQREEVLKVNNNVYFLPPKELNKIHGLLDKITRDIGKTSSLVLEQPSPARATAFDSDLAVSGQSIDSIVPISTGCLGECSYCITRLARGKLQSYPEDKILTEVSDAVSLGRLEIRLTAQDTACYGYDSNTTLVNLLSRIVALNTASEFRLRVGMMNPDSVRAILKSIIKAYNHARIFKFLHLPVQSGDDEILMVMGRSYYVSDFLKIVNDFRKNYHKITVSTDIIVGYPGESEEEFSHSLELIEKLQPNIVNITRFSARPGTRAGKLRSKLSGSKIKARSRKLTKLRFKISKELNERELGEEYTVLVTERVKKDSVLCRNDNYLPIVIKQELTLGSWQRVHIIDATDSYVIGRLVK